MLVINSSHSWSLFIFLVRLLYGRRRPQKFNQNASDSRVDIKRISDLLSLDFWWYCAWCVMCPWKSMFQQGALPRSHIFFKAHFCTHQGTSFCPRVFSWRCASRPRRAQQPSLGCSARWTKSCQGTRGSWPTRGSRSAFSWKPINFRTVGASDAVGTNGFWKTLGPTSSGFSEVIPTERKAWSSWPSHCMKPWSRIMLTWHRSFSSSVQNPPWKTPGVARLMTMQRVRPHATRSWRRNRQRWTVSGQNECGKANHKPTIFEGLHDNLFVMILGVVSFCRLSLHTSWLW